MIEPGRGREPPPNLKNSKPPQKAEKQALLGHTNYFSLKTFSLLKKFLSTVFTDAGVFS